MSNKVVIRIEGLNAVVEELPDCWMHGREIVYIIDNDYPRYGGYTLCRSSSDRFGWFGQNRCSLRPSELGFLCGGHEGGIIARRRLVTALVHATRSWGCELVILGGYDE
jgi:hypothetical protein